MKLYLLLILFICSIFSTYSQDNHVELVYKNGERKYGKGHFNYESKVAYYSYEKRNKEVLVSFSELKEVTFYHHSYWAKYLNKKVKGKEYYIIMRELELGKLSLYRHYEINEYKYYILEENSHEVIYIKIGLSNKKLKERLMPYIGKCKKSLMMVDKKEFDIRQIIRFYNTHCDKKLTKSKAN